MIDLLDLEKKDNLENNVLANNFILLLFHKKIKFIFIFISHP